MTDLIDKKARENQLAGQYRQAVDKRNDAIRAAASAAMGCGFATVWNISGWFAESFIRHEIQLPSETLEKNFGWLFGTIVPERFHRAFMHTCDNIRDRNYSTSWTRRSFRSSDYRRYAETISFMIREFWTGAIIDADICDILTGNLPEEVRCYLKSESPRPDGYPPEVLAYELDRDNPRLEAIITDIINGENSFSGVTHSLIKGIILSHNTRMHRLLCKLLLAARLQEGLRQAICEGADSGSREAFMAILETIRENDLIRFSSVKRAVGTWVGLISEESRDLDRISSKTLDLISSCLADADFRNECLRSEDAMQLYIALWSLGYESVESAISALQDISCTGTRHQILTAGYFVKNIEYITWSHGAVRSVLNDHMDCDDIVALYLPYLMPDGTRMCSSVSPTPKPATPDNYFSNSEEALAFCDRLTEKFMGMKQKSREFDPCVFPWNKEVLKKSELIQKAMLIAAIENNQARIDAFCAFLPDCDPDYRDTYFKLLTSDETTPAVRAAILKTTSDKTEHTRGAAFLRLKTLPLTPEEYLILEDNLRLKYDDLRKNTIELLLKQSDDSLYATTERLLSAKKAEKRTAGLDMLTQLGKDDRRNALFDRCLPLTGIITNPTSQEKILIDALKPKAEAEEADLPFSETDRYVPKIEITESLRHALRLFASFFPDSRLEAQVLGGMPAEKGDLPPEGICLSAEKARVMLKSLSAFFTAHEYETFKSHPDSPTMPISTDVRHFFTVAENVRTPRMDLWEQWMAEQNPDTGTLLGMFVIAHAQPDQSCSYAKTCAGYIRAIFGSGFEIPSDLPYLEHMRNIVSTLVELRISSDDMQYLAAAVGAWVSLCLPDEMVLGEKEGPNIEGFRPERKETSDGRIIITHTFGDMGHPPLAQFIAYPQIVPFVTRIEQRADASFSHVPSIILLMYSRAFKAYQDYMDARNLCPSERKEIINQIFFSYPSSGYTFPNAMTYILARHFGLIGDSSLWFHLSETGMLSSALTICTSVMGTSLEDGRYLTAHAFRGGNIHEQRHNFEIWIGTCSELNDDQLSLVDVCRKAGEVLLPMVLEPELRRGDISARYSGSVSGITFLEGTDIFVRILSALGKDTLDRGVYWHCDGSKRGNLSFLLYRCVPKKSDTADTLKTYLEGTDISRKRLIEAALFNPAWIDIVGEYLNLPGLKSACYYFIAHMNESFDERKMAVIARFTPLEADELNQGAFDIQWFKSAREQLGQKDFDLIYDAAKYICDSNRHTRARKYADATLGKLEIEPTESAVLDKRNKDLLMAYALIPVANEDEIARRYLFIQAYLKESRKFGAQRAASEKIAAEIALRNLATNAGFADAMRLTLRMETKLAADNRELFTDHAVDDFVMRLTVDEQGSADIICLKDGKPLKSIPARVKKNPWVMRLVDVKKQLSAQHRRTRLMFEEAMEDESVFTLEELTTLMENPVVAPILSKLVFMSDNMPCVFNENRLRMLDGEPVSSESSLELRIAHPVHLYKGEHWIACQRYIYDNKIAQPFRQVFRELYVKTPDEEGCERSLRYAGNQIQPSKAAACLKSRRWITDIDSGLQKVYYRENIVATIFALADWFTPADIEAPTLEYVAFFDRKTDMPLNIDDIPDIIFSEVMRDVDMAVSVAHAGEVDPEASHSTVEMRAAILSFTLPLLRLENVDVRGDHAIIDGSLARYSIHLGSGVVHQIGGTMLNVIPVHAQHRARIFLPFVDNDPKTAEIISKVILFSEDKKIKDPTILEQIMR